MSDLMNMFKEGVHKELDKINNTQLMKSLSIELIKAGETPPTVGTPFKETVTTEQPPEKSDIIHTNFKLPITYLNSSSVFRFLRLYVMIYSFVRQLLIMAIQHQCMNIYLNQNISSQRK